MKQRKKCQTLIFFKSLYSLGFVTENTENKKRFLQEVQKKTREREIPSNNKALCTKEEEI